MRRGLFVSTLATAAGGGLLASCGKTHDVADATSKPVAQPFGARSEMTMAPRNGAPSRAMPAAPPKAMLKPPRLRKGDTVALVAPAGPLRHAADLEHAKREAALLGLRLVMSQHIHDQYGYLAGSDAARAEDFNHFARDPQIRAIFALRGGYGTMRILDDIDYSALADDPKVILGFSDLTALLNAITSRTGLITFHGPLAGHSILSGTLIGGIQRAVMSSEPLGVMRVPEIGTLAAGAARGQLMGGNLSLVAALSGTPYAVPCAGKILLLEEVNEAPYRVDRMLTQLRLNGDLHAVAGIALGRFQNCVAKTDDDRPSLTIDETLLDRLLDLNKPMITHIGIGHMEDQWTLPLGMMAAFDGGAGTLVIEESAVS
jgi:muramoyltetrapeptide carboxypeptidase